ncbi:ATP-binding protein [Myxococcaceae bacterium GXIMD 01537]
MTSQAWVSLVACAGLLALAVLALARVGRSPLALPLSLLAISLSTWNFASFAHSASGEPGWRFMVLMAALMTAPCALHLILAFVGRRRQLAWAVFATYGLFGAAAAAALASLWLEPLAQAVTSHGFALAVLALALPLLCAGFSLLVLHQRRADTPEERARAGLVLLGLTLLVALLGTDLCAELGWDMPRLGNLGTLLGVPVMAMVTLRFHLFGSELSTGEALYAALVALLGVLAYLAVSRLFAGEMAALGVGAAGITLALLAATRRGVSAFVAERERLRHLATLGRFSAQMAHDLKNPIAAVKGAAQYLQEEHARGHSWDGQGDFLVLLLEQVERLERVVDTYQRLGRVEPLRAPLDVNRVVERVLSHQAFAGPGAVEVRRELAAGLPPCDGDFDLLAHALENLVRNACEAMPRGGTLTVRTAAEGPWVTLSVEDTGEGMDARTRERAFDDFYTTKATGSGLGLAFVRRVVDAHGGQVTLTSREGRGTIVHLRLPASTAAEGAHTPGKGMPWPSL